MIRKTPTMRVVCSTLVLTALLAFTAETFDRTEALTIALWAVLWALAEVVWYAHEDNRRGRVRPNVLPLCVLAAAALMLARPPRTAYVERLPGETEERFLERAALVIARAHAWS